MDPKACRRDAPPPSNSSSARRSGQDWVHGNNSNPKVPNYYTDYFATVSRIHIAIGVTFSAYREKLSQPHGVSIQHGPRFRPETHPNH